MKPNPAVQAKCRQCGIPLEPRRSTRRYCSGKCRTQAYRTRLRKPKLKRAR